MHAGSVSLQTGQRKSNDFRTKQIVYRTVDAWHILEAKKQSRSGRCQKKLTPTIILHSTLTAEAAGVALRNSIDEEQRTLFSLSGYGGDRPVLGEIRGNEFRLQKRRYWRNDFAPQFYGRLQAEPSGTKIEGYFDLSRWVKRFMRWWLAGVVLLASPIAVLALLDMVRGSHHLSEGSSPWVGVLVPPGMIVFGILLPKFGRLMGHPEESFILGFLERTLAAQRERVSAK